MEYKFFGFKKFLDVFYYVLLFIYYLFTFYLFFIQYIYNLFEYFRKKKKNE